MQCGGLICLSWLDVYSKFTESDCSHTHIQMYTVFLRFFWQFFFFSLPGISWRHFMLRRSCFFPFLGSCFVCNFFLLIFLCHSLKRRKNVQLRFRKMKTGATQIYSHSFSISLFFSGHVTLSLIPFFFREESASVLTECLTLHKIGFDSEQFVC